MTRSPPPDVTHVPTDAQRHTVRLHATVGTDQPTIARVIGVDPKTLRKHYRDELDISKAKANATVGGALFNKAKGGDTAAMIFWMKTQAGWREKTDLNHTSDDGSMTPRESSDAVLGALKAKHAPKTD